MAGRKATITRKVGDLVPTATRLPEGIRDELKAAGDVTGRSMNGEIIYRLEDYDRMQRAYALVSEKPEARRACQIVAALAERVPADAENFRDQLGLLIRLYFEKSGQIDPYTIHTALEDVHIVKAIFETDPYAIGNRIGRIMGLIESFPKLPSNSRGSVESFRKYMSRKIEEERAAVIGMNDEDWYVQELDKAQAQLDALEKREGQGATDHL